MSALREGLSNEDALTNIYSLLYQDLDKGLFCSVIFVDKKKVRLYEPYNVRNITIYDISWIIETEV